MVGVDWLSGHVLDSNTKALKRGRRSAGSPCSNVIVALIIAGLGLTLLLGAVSQSLGNAQTADRYLEATRRAQAHLAEIGVYSPLAPGVTTGDDGGGYAWRTEISQPLLQQPPPTRGREAPGALYYPGNGELAGGWPDAQCLAAIQTRDATMRSRGHQETGTWLYAAGVARGDHGARLLMVALTNGVRFAGRAWELQQQHSHVRAISMRCIICCAN